MMSRFLTKTRGKCIFGMGSKVSLIKELSLIKDKGPIELMNEQIHQDDTGALPEVRSIAVDSST